jgi:hypothetical protein
MSLQYLDTAIGVAVVMLAVSLLITILVQLVANVLSLRGSNLRWAVTTLIKEVHPDLQSVAPAIAQQALTHPLISDSTLSAFSKTWGLQWLVQRVSLANAVRLEELVGVMDVLGDAAAAPGTPAKAMATIASTAKNKMGPQVQAVTTQATELVDALSSAAAGKNAGWATGTINVDQLLGKVPGAAETVFGKDIKSWFNSTMDRAAQRFTLQMRIVTVAISIAVALAMHLDTLKLVADLSSSSELRASAVAEAGSIERLAADIKPAQANATDEAKAADAKKTSELLGEAGDIRGLLDETRLQLIPSPYPGRTYRRREMFGILFSAGLLGLGAPFWFSALKSMTALRPVLANKQDKESKSAA